VGVFRDCPIFWVPPLSQELVKLRNSNFVHTFNNFYGRLEQKLVKKLEKVAVGVVRESRKFSGYL